MRKIICVVLSVLMALSLFAFVGCNDNNGDNNKEEATLKFGLGVYVDVSKASNAEADKNGQGQAVITAAAVTVDADGKIVSCVVDTADNTVAYTGEGKAIANESFKTKYEMGKDYNMVAYGGAAKEWFEQADAFEKVVAGKTLTEVKALVAEGNKGTGEVVNAGCTIMIDEFVFAIEKAYNSAVASNVTASHTLKLGMHTEQSCQDADGDKNGSNQVETTIFAAAVDANGKVVAASSDCAQVKFTFDNKGASTYDLTKEVSTKKEAGENYGMKAYGGAAKEWFEQAAAFDTACVGKTATEIAAMMGSDNYGNADLKGVGCTILVNGFVKAASKIN
jgi:hypothetical protein